MAAAIYYASSCECVTLGVFANALLLVMKCVDECVVSRGVCYVNALLLVVKSAIVMHCC